MWLLSLIEQVNMDEMTEMGLQLTAEQIYSINQASLKDAVGALDGGSCTAELVSPDGLLLTNHHCGYDEIQYHSSVEHDYLKNGFWAMTREEELPNEGKTITFLVRMEEVTDQIAPELNENMNPRMSAIQRSVRFQEQLLLKPPREPIMKPRSGACLTGTGFSFLSLKHTGM